MTDSMNPSTEDFASMFEDSAGAATLVEGKVVPATVISNNGDYLVLDVGLKTEGRVASKEFLLEEKQPEAGDIVEVYLDRIENLMGEAVLSRDKARREESWIRLEDNYNKEEPVKGAIVGRVKGGFTVDLGGVNAFLPGSQVDIRPVRDVGPLMNEVQPFAILKMDRARGNVVVSRRAILEESRAEQRAEIVGDMNEGDTREGVVKNITDYGAFVDLDGLDGLLHITDMSWGRIQHPSEMVKQGEELEVMIIEIDRDRERVSLGLKQLKNNPWDKIEEKYPIGSTVSGKVVNMVPYGAFVEIEQGVEGLVHVTELSWTKRITKPSEVLRIGEEIQTVILGIQKEDQKISLGTRQLDVNPWDMVRHNYPAGARVRGKVRNLTTYGAFIELEEGIDGMVHVSDMSWTRKINHPSEMVKKGDEVDAIVLDVDADGQRISLGMRQLTTDPWEEIDTHFKIGDMVKGKVSKITSYGAFVELENDIDGLVHISQVSEEHIEKIKAVLTVNDEVTARVIKIDKDERRIGLSIKAANYSDEDLAKERQAFENVTGVEDLTNLGDILDQATK